MHVLDARRPRARRQRARGAADVGRRVRGRRARRRRRAARDRPEVTTIGILGPLDGRGRARSWPRRGPRRRAPSIAASPRRPTRTGSPARRSGSPGCPIPGAVAWPLAWLTTRVYLQPRGHTVALVSARRHAVRAIRRAGAAGPRHGRRRRAGRRPGAARRGAPRLPAPDAVTETLVVEGGRHSLALRVPRVPRRDRALPRRRPRRPAHARRGGARSPRPSPRARSPTPSAS